MQTSVISLKEKLHQRIEGIDDEKFLEAFYTILDKYKNDLEHYELTDIQLHELEKREADYLSGKDKGLTIEDHIKLTKQKYGF